MTVRYRVVLVSRKPLSEQGCFELFGLCLGGNLSYDEMLAERDRLADEEEAKRLEKQGKPRPMELTLEMVECMKLQHTIVDGWTADCGYCKINRQNKVIRENGVCVVSLRCLDWLNEQEVRLKGCENG